jgi:flagellin FlaB
MIFIAMVLIAAVAASVLIQISRVLKEKAQSTGEEATAEVASNFVVKNVEGIRGNDSGSLSAAIDLVELRISLSAGGDPIDLSRLVLTISDGTQRNK